MVYVVNKKLNKVGSFQFQNGRLSYDVEINDSPSEELNQCLEQEKIHFNFKRQESNRYRYFASVRRWLKRQLDYAYIDPNYFNNWKTDAETYNIADSRWDLVCPSIISNSKNIFSGPLKDGEKIKFFKDWKDRYKTELYFESPYLEMVKEYYDHKIGEPDSSNEYKYFNLSTTQTYKGPNALNCGVLVEFDHSSRNISLVDTSIRGGGSCSSTGNTMTYNCETERPICNLNLSTITLCRNGFIDSNAFYSKDGRGSCDRF